MNIKAQVDGLINRKPLPGLHLSAVLVLCAMLAMTVVFFYQVRDRESAIVKANFDWQASSYAAAVQRGIDRSLEVVDSLGGLFEASPNLERSEFAEFVSSARSRHGDIQALEWIPRVKDSERASYEEAASNWFPGFQFTDRKAQGEMEREGQRAEYYPVYYVEPLAGNETAVGFDLASNPTRLEALQKSRDTGEMVASARVILVQELHSEYGFLIFRPVYRHDSSVDTIEERQENLVGFALGVFRIGDMVEDSLKYIGPSGISFRLVDEGAPPDEGFLYLHRESATGDEPLPESEEPVAAHAGLHSSITLNLPGRTWSLSLYPTAKYLAGHSQWGQWAALGAGLAFTLALGILFFFLMSRNIAARRLAAQLSEANQTLQTEMEERKRAEEALRESESLYRSLVSVASQAGIGIALLQDTETQEANIAFANGEFAHITAYSREELPRLSWLDVVHPACSAEVASRYRTRLRGKPAPPLVEYSIVSKGGEVRPVELSAGPITYKGKPGVAIYIRDVTQRKQAEQALRESEERYRQLVELSPDAIYIREGDKIVFINAAGARLFGAADPGELVGRSSLELIHPDYHDIARERMRLIRETGKPVPLLEEKFSLLDGSVIDVEVAASPIAYQGRPAAQVVVRDITARKRVEVALRESEQKYRNLAENAADILLVMDLKGQLTYISRNVDRETGYSEGEILGMNIQSLLTPKSYATAMERVRKWVAGVAELPPYEVEIVTKAGSTVPFELSTSAIKEGDELKRIQIIARNVTERKRMDEELRDSRERLRILFEYAPDAYYLIDMSLSHKPLVRIWRSSESRFRE